MAFIGIIIAAALVVAVEIDPAGTEKLPVCRCTVSIWLGKPGKSAGECTLVAGSCPTASCRVFVFGSCAALDQPR